MPSRIPIEIFMDGNVLAQGVVKLSDVGFTPSNLQVGQMLALKNLLWRGGLQQRLGMIKFSANQVSPGDKVNGLHRFYRDGDATQLLATAGPLITQYDVATDTWTTLKSGRSTAGIPQLTTYGPTNRVLIADGVNTPQSWDGTAVSDYTGPPADSKQFIIHLERVFAISTGLGIDRSDNLLPDTWTEPKITLGSNDPTINAAVKHTQSTADSSVVSQLVFFTDNETWILVGTDFTSTLNGVFLHQISGDIGTAAIKTIVKTPRGVIFLGRQSGRNDIFLLSGEGENARIDPLGANIRQELARLPASGIDEATATYNDGYYRLSMRTPGSITNKTEWWLNIDNLERGISFFGPMDRNVGLFTYELFSGGGDNNEIIGGGEDGFVYTLDTSFSDAGVAIASELQTGLYDMGVSNHEKIMEDIFFNIQASGGTLTASLIMDDSFTEDSQTFTFATIGGSFPYDFPFDFQRAATNVKSLNFRDTKPRGTYVSLKLEFSDLDEQYIINALGLKGRLIRQVNKEG